MDNYRRGNYFNYLKDVNIPIPHSTLQSRHHQTNDNLRQLQVAGIDRNNENNRGINVNGYENIEQNIHEVIMDDVCSNNSSFLANENNSPASSSLDNIDDECNNVNDIIRVGFNEDDLNESMLFNDPDDLDENQSEQNSFDDNISVAAVDILLNDENEAVHEERRNEIRAERELINERVSLTKEESDLLIMSYAIRHNLTDTALEDLLDLINCHLPEKLNYSKYKFLKRFPTISEFKSFYYCPDCLMLLTFTNASSRCASCSKNFLLNSLKRNGHFYLHIPLKTQLSNLFSSPLFYQLNRNHEHQFLNDVTSGAVYKFLRENNIISNYDISLQWNADGVQTFKSSKVSMCPIQVALNELKSSVRNENILLTGLWAAAEKPDLNLFMKPFVDELKDLHENGFQCFPPNVNEPITIKVHTILSAVDSVERCALQNLHQYNGTYGCTFCLNPGEHIPIGRGYTRIYSGLGIKRTTDQHRRDAIQAEQEGTIIHGVKGVSVLMLLPVFDIIRSFPPEYMHSVLLGVVKLFLSNWIDPKNCSQPWYIGTQLHIIDARLNQIFPPSEITRTPQSITNLSQWKASEFKNFLLYYSLPILNDILSSAFYKHWSLFVYAINIFNSDNIDQCKFLKAKSAIEIFVMKAETLYGQQIMKYNLHLMLHLPDAVKDFGALWAWSAFPFESYNFILRKMLHSSQAVLQQICKSYLRYQSIKYIDTFTKPDCSALGKALYLNMIEKYRSRTGLRAGDENRLVLFGEGEIIELSLVEKLSIEALVRENVDNLVTKYERFIYNNVLYHGSSYKKIWKRNNSIAQIMTGNYIKITSVLRVITSSGMKKHIVIGKAFEVLDEVLCSYNNFSSSDYSTAVKETNIITCFPRDICSKCIILPCNTSYYVMKLVNKIETD